MRRITSRKLKTVNLYVDGKYICDVVEAALDNHVMVDDMKKTLREANAGKNVEFRVEER